MDFKQFGKIVKAVATHASDAKAHPQLARIEVARAPGIDRLRLIATDGRGAIVVYVPAPPDVAATIPREDGAKRYWDPDGAVKRLAASLAPEPFAEPAPGCAYPDVRAVMTIAADDEPRTAPHVGVNPIYLAESCKAIATIAKACGGGKLVGVKITLPPDGRGPIHVRWGGRDCESVHAAVMPMML